MKKKLFALVAMLLTLCMVLTACGGNNAGSGNNTAADNSGSNNAGGTTDEGGADTVRFAVIFGVGGLGDQGYNDEVNEGCQMAVEQLGVEYVD